MAEAAVSRELGCVRASSCASDIGSSIVVSQAGVPRFSPSRFLRPRVMKNRNRRLARPRPTHLSGPSIVVGTGPALGVAGLANAIWAACIVSPRAVLKPTAAPTVDFSDWKTAGGTDLSTSSAMSTLLTPPMAFLVLVTFLGTTYSVAPFLDLYELLLDPAPVGLE